MEEFFSEIYAEIGTCPLTGYLTYAADVLEAEWESSTRRTLHSMKLPLKVMDEGARTPKGLRLK